jgi:hypothetical protein
MLQCINRAADNDWRAAAKFLEIAFPAKYRRADTRVEVNIKAQAGEVQIDCVSEQRRALVEAHISSVNGKMLFKSYI